MRAADCTAAGRQGADAERLDSEQFQGVAAANDVGDGIGGTDLVEVDGLGGGVVDARLGLG
jgi:hypothetical protein